MPNGKGQKSLGRHCLAGKGRSTAATAITATHGDKAPVHEQETHHAPTTLK